MFLRKLNLTNYILFSPNTFHKKFILWFYFYIYSCKCKAFGTHTNSHTPEDTRLYLIFGRYHIIFLLRILFFFFRCLELALFIIIIIIYFTIFYWFCYTSICIRHGCTHVPCPEPPSHLPPHIIPLGHPSAPAPSFLYPA